MNDTCTIHTHTHTGIWQRSRVWVDPLKIGQMAGMQKGMDVFAKRKKEKKSKEDEDDDDNDMTRRRWLKVMMTANDGWRYVDGACVIH